MIGMSLRSIKKMNTKQLQELQKNITLEILKKTQKEYDNAKYPEKTRNDKLICQICGGKYTRKSKSHHDKGKKHIKKANEFLENN
jgi:hypothetical protein